MKNNGLVIWGGIVAIIVVAGTAFSEQVSPETSKDMAYRQREFYNQLKYLNDKEQKIANELNEEVSSHNQNPSAITMQRVEDLKIKIVENLQDQIRSDREYIAYLERKVSDFLKSDFQPFTVVEDTGKLKEAADEMMEKLDAGQPIVAAEQPVAQVITTGPDAQSDRFGKLDLSLGS